MTEDMTEDDYKSLYNEYRTATEKFLSALTLPPLLDEGMFVTKELQANFSVMGGKLTLSFVRTDIDAKKL